MGREEEDEEAIRNKLRASWKKKPAQDVAEGSKDQDKPQDKPEKSSSRAPEDRRSSRASRSSRRSRSPRRHRSRRRSSRRSRSFSPSRSRSRSSGRRRRRHSSHKRRSRSTSRAREAKKARKEAESPSKKKSEDKKEKDADETETENEEEVKKEAEENGKEDKKDDKKEDKKDRSSKKSRRSRSASPRSPSRSSRRRRHRRSSYSRSRSASRSRRPRRGSRSRSRSARRARGRDRDRERDRRSRRRRSYSRSRSRSYSNSRRRRRDRSSSRDRPRRDGNSSPEPHQHPPTAADADPAAGGAPTATGSVVNPTITQLMAQYPTMSLQDIIAKMQASNVTMAAAVAQKPARELYVGNLPPNVTGPQLQEFLGTIIQQVGLTTSPGNPIMNTWISTDGHFAFCEMRTVEECNLALLLNQLSLLGQPLKFGRPRSFMGPPQPMPQTSARTQTALANLGCTPNPAWFAQSAIPGVPSELPTEAALDGMTEAATADTHSNRLVMMNIPVVLTEDQVKELVQPFGALKSFSLVKDTATGASMGSALFEYEDESVTESAVGGLNGLDIGGILLSVQRQPHNSPVGALPAATPEQTSAVLKMANMVSVDELRDDEEYADLAEDVEEECKRFGTVASMEIPRPKDGEEVPGLGCIYVRFEQEADAISALKALSGRKFGGNIVKVTHFPADKFEKREFS